MADLSRERRPSGFDAPIWETRSEGGARGDPASGRSFEIAGLGLTAQMTIVARPPIRLSRNARVPKPDMHAVWVVLYAVALIGDRGHSTAPDELQCQCERGDSSKGIHPSFADGSERILSKNWPPTTGLTHLISAETGRPGLAPLVLIPRLW